eukprot:198817_1
MMSTVLIVLFGTLLCSPYATDPFVWPLPSTYTISSTLNLNLANSFNITTSSTSQILQRAIKRYMDEIIFIHRPDGTPATPLASSLTVTAKTADESLQLDTDESYTLSINSGISNISANTIYGAIRGLETFSQLVLYNFTVGYYQAYTSHVSDEPRFQWRGTLIDTGRHYLPVRSIKQLLQSMSYAKLNVLHWHIVDTQSFPYVSRVYPKLASAAPFNDYGYQRYSLNDIAGIVSFAQERGIRVVPEFDMPAHTGSWCYGYPEICPNATCNTDHSEADFPDGILNPANNFTYELIEGLFNEATNVFMDEYFHIGGDEVTTNCWDQTPQIVSWEKANGLTDRSALLYFYKRALDIVNNRLIKKRKAVQWDDIFSKFEANISNTETTIQVWHGADLIGDVVKAGFQSIFSPSSEWYLDFLVTSWQTMYTAEPAQNITDPNDLKLLLGGEGCMWGESVDASDLEQTIWPRMSAIAERLWSPRGVNSTQNAEPRYTYFRCLLNQRGVAAAPFNNSDGRQPPHSPGDCYKQR